MRDMADGIMVSRRWKMRAILIVLAVVVFSIPFIYQGCRIQEGQLQATPTSTKWVVTPDGGVLTMTIVVENKAGCNASLTSLEFRIYRLLYEDNSTEDVDLLDTQPLLLSIGPGTQVEINYAFAQAFTQKPKAVMARITLLLEDGSSIEVFDGLIETAAIQAPT